MVTVTWRLLTDIFAGRLVLVWPLDEERRPMPSDCVDEQGGEGCLIAILHKGNCGYTAFEDCLSRPLLTCTCR